MKAPSPPDPVATAQAQAQYNKQAAVAQGEINMVNQSTPYGSVNYNQTGTAADGTPTFTATTSYTPQAQGLLDQQMATQKKMGGEASNLTDQLSGLLSKAPDFSTDAVTNQLLGYQKSYMQPIFDQQQSNVDSKLAAQGIAQGSQAWNNAQNLQARNVDNAYESAMANDQQQAYNQAVSNYLTPIQTVQNSLSALYGNSTPAASVNQTTAATPTESIQAPNYENLAEQNYQSQNSNYENMLSGLFGIGSAALGGWAKGGFATPSDRRIKRDIRQVGTLFDGSPVYRFRYLDDPRMTIGLMAQDVERTRPHAVHEINGVKHVDYEAATEDMP